MKLWQKNFTPDKTIEQFTVGKDRELDLQLAQADVIGSMAHIRMLREIDLLKKEEQEKLHEGLKKILEEINNNEFSIEEGVEDVHSQVELMLTRSLDDLGKRIHSGRSRNDQVLLDLKLFMREQVREISDITNDLFQVLLDLSEKNKDVLMPGYTHFQVAMPSSFGLWFGAYAESLADDMIHLKAAFDIINRNPLGSAAGYGSSFPLNRKVTTDLLGFESMNYNVIYAQMGRGKAERSLSSALESFAETLNKLAYDVCLYMNQNYGFIKFPDEYTTGSSIMPHKKNPDVFEIIRGRSNQVKARGNEIRMITGNLPSGYHRDLQLIKEALFESINWIKECLYMTSFMMKKIEVRKDILENEIYDYLFTVEKVNELVQRGTSFRDAYKEVAEMIEKGKFKPDKNLRHTHEGSLGNLCNDRIRELMDTHREYFTGRFARIDECIHDLIENK